MSVEKTLVKVTFIEGDDIKGNFPSSWNLKKVANWVKKTAREVQKRKLRPHLYEKGVYKFYLLQPHPKTVFDVEKETKSLGELFGAKANLIVKDKEVEVKIEKGEGSIEDAKIKDHGLITTNLKNDDPDERERFEKELRMDSADAKKLELEKRKLELMKVRLQIEEDKHKRLDKVWVKKKEEDEEMEMDNETV